MILRVDSLRFAEMEIFGEDVHFVEQGFEGVRGEQINFYIEKESKKDGQQISIITLFLSLHNFGQACLKVIKIQTFLTINIFSRELFSLTWLVSFGGNSLRLLLGLVRGREGLWISNSRGLLRYKRLTFLDVLI